jgi:hypothetical protein
MKIVPTTIACLCLTLSAPALAEGKGWRGIRPSRSTRADVERLLGPPVDAGNEYASVYRLEKETVIFNYEGGRPCEAPGGWQVPRGTVVGIMVTPKTKLPLSDLQVDEGRYKKTSGGHRSEDIVYTNNEEGESVTVYQGEVTSISYFPASGDNHLRRPDARDTSNGGRGRAVYYALDTYHDVPFEVEKSALDNFAVSLLEDPENQGYIVAYAGRRGRGAEARERAARAKNYLINEHGLKAERIAAIDGGYREEFTVELYLVPRGAPAPTPTPTVVQIIRDGRTRDADRRSSRPRCNR